MLSTYISLIWVSGLSINDSELLNEDPSLPPVASRELSYLQSLPLEAVGDKYI